MLIQGLGMKVLRMGMMSSEERMSHRSRKPVNKEEIPFASSEKDECWMLWLGFVIL